MAANPVPIKPGPVITNSGIEGLNIPSTNFVRSEDAALEESSWVTKRAIALRDAVSSLLVVRHAGDEAKNKVTKDKKKGGAGAGANSNSTATAAANNSTTAHAGKGKKGKGGGHAGAAGNATAAATNVTTAASNTTAANNGTATGKKHHKAAGGKANDGKANAKGGNGNGANGNGGNGGAQQQSDNGLANLIGDILGGNLRKREVRRSLNLWETEALRDAVGL